ncbi:hypothetical protein GQ54DRAFT_169377 [Martensiomyces pterosporus]|nr:hypothetical protein GQ54DRAFT_169377 [Martensiomyces pterosporus]
MLFFHVHCMLAPVGNRGLREEGYSPCLQDMLSALPAPLRILHNAKRSSDDSHDEKKVKKPGRKPITTEATTKRTAQNRAAQRAFRERKQQYLKGLEDKVQELTEQQERTERENNQLKKYVDKLKKENVSLKNGKFTYQEPPASVDFDKAITELFDSPSSSGLNLSSAFDLQQAALQGTDLTKPGAMSSISSNLQGGATATTNASPQSVPNLYPGLDLSSATAGTLASSLVQNRSTPPALTGRDALLSTTSSSLTTGFSNDILNSIQMLASNQNISTGSFINQLFDSPANSSSSAVPISPTHFGMDTRSSSIISGLGANDRGPSRSPVLSASATTPTDMFVPLSSLNAGMPNGMLSLDAFKQHGGFADFASLMQQHSTSSSGQTPESSQAIGTPSFSDLLSLSPSRLNEGLISVVPTSADATSASASSAMQVSASLPALLQQSTAYQAQLAAAMGGKSQAENSPVLPPQLMAYRNPDPVGITDDGDQLEKLLLNNLYSLKSTSGSEVSAASMMSHLTAMANGAQGADLASMSSALAPLPVNPSKSGSSEGSGHTAVQDGDVSKDKKAEPVCTCRQFDDSPCAPCPKHGSPADISDEIKEMAPQMLNYVCTETNRLADDELNDLCSLMYKHAKCSEVQRRVEMERERLKMESELELLQTKQSLTRKYGLH